MSGATICPCVTPTIADPHVYREQIERVAFAPRVHIDVMDGAFAPNKNLNPIQLWWPDGMLADIHLMYRQPGEQLETLISLRPHMIILHGESEGNIADYLRHIKRFNIKTGVALLADTPVDSMQGCIEIADHVMLFSGTLGQFGGQADMSLLAKISRIRAMHPEVEIGWDGGANQENVQEIARAGVAVINVGGAIQRSDDPRRVYDELTELVVAS